MGQTNSLHNRLIAQACTAGWSKGGWKKGIREQLVQPSWAGDHTDQVEDVDEVGILFDRVKCVPDAWRIKVEGEGAEAGWLHPVLVLEFLEVEVSHRIDDNKWAELTRFWFALDATEYFHLRVYRMDQFGMVTLVLDEHSALQVMSYLYGPDGVFSREVPRTHTSTS